MSGRIELFHYGISAIALTAVITDLAWGRIFNWLTFGAFLAGLIYSSVTQGWSGAESSLLGAAAGLVLYGWMFFLRVLGGGDVKLLMALGAWGGAGYAAEVALLSVFSGGVMAALMLLARGQFTSLCRRLYRFAFTLLTPNLEVEKLKVDPKQTMPFGVPIAVSAVWTAFAHPLLSWGLHL